MKRLLFLAALTLASVSQANEPTATSVIPGADHVAQILQRWEAGQTKEALLDVKRWKKADDKSPWPWVASAALSFEQKKYGRCVSMADAALKRNPHSAEAYYWRGRGLEQKGKALEAANEYQAALEAEPGHAAATESLVRVQAGLVETSSSQGTN